MIVTRQTTYTLSVITFTERHHLYIRFYGNLSVTVATSQESIHLATRHATEYVSMKI